MIFVSTPCAKSHSPLADQIKAKMVHKAITTMVVGNIGIREEMLAWYKAAVLIEGK
jgi:hypothetical protein